MGPHSLLFTEMVNATSSLELGHGRQKVSELSREDGPIGVQLFDHRPTAMAAAARRAEDAGAFSIDINMGCPVRKIAKKGGGAGLIREPDMAGRIVEAVSRAVQIPVTVKTRLGWCASDADPVTWCQQLEQAGAQWLTVHGRTRAQGFKGQGRLACDQGHHDRFEHSRDRQRRHQQSCRCPALPRAHGCRRGHGRPGNHGRALVDRPD